MIMSAATKRISLACLIALTIGSVVCVHLVSPGHVVAGGKDIEKTLEDYEETVEQAMDRGLEFLASQQLADGSFRGQMQGVTAVVSLSVMAFLAKGYTPGVGPYGEEINRGIDFVLSCAQDNGVLVGRAGSPGGGMYSHAIATLFLSEVSGMVDPERQKKIDEALPKALRVVLAAQQMKKRDSHQGGWRYEHNSRDSDISCTGWPLMALRSARNAAAAVPAQAIEDGVKFVMNCRCKDGGFAYQPGAGSGVARTGTALLCLELCGHHGETAAIGAGDYILKHPTDSNYLFYGAYYTAQGMYQLGGEHWEKHARQMYETLLPMQQSNGSWPTKGSDGGRAGPCYTTAMAILALSVPCCQLPIYQR